MTTKCPKCGGGQIELQPHGPKNSHKNLLFVQCASCGAAITTVTQNNLDNELAEIQRKLDYIMSRVT